MMNFNVNNPNYKAGVKVLTKKQMQTGLPSYDQISLKIEKIRHESLNVNRELLTCQMFESLKYDQIFSVLGGRGAGKTSVLMTLHHELQSDERNIILPLVMPELLDTDESIVGWLLSAMEYNLIQIEKKISAFGFKGKTNHYRQFCENYRLFERCVFNHNNTLREKFVQLKSAYYTKEYRTCKISESDASTIKDLMAAGVDDSFSLINRFVDYWNVLVDVYSVYLREKFSLDDNKNEQTVPLIFIFIDDADLKPQIINELLFVIPKYLSHPNVVVFVSASQKTLTFTVKNYMFKSITQKPFDLMELMKVEHQYNNVVLINGRNRSVKFHDLRYGREYDKIIKLSDEVLRKIFPVYNRFYLKKYDRYEDKRLLQIFKNEKAECQETMRLSDKITELLRDFYSDIFEIYGDPMGSQQEPTIETLVKKKENFKLLTCTQIESEYEFGSELYLSFLGKYPRDIMSVYYSLKDMLVSLTELLDKYYKNNITANGTMPLSFSDTIYEIVTKFISAAVASNRNLSMFSRHVPNLVKTQLLHWQLYVDYEKILEIFRDNKYILTNKRNYSSFVEMFCLLNFVEQLIILVMPQRRTSHGHIEFMELLKLCEVEIIKESSNMDSLFRQYYMYYSLNLIPGFDINRREHQGSFIAGVHALGLVEENDLRNDIKKNSVWYELLAKALFLRGSIVARIMKRKNNLFILSVEKFTDSQYNQLYENYYDYLERIFLHGERPQSLGRSRVRFRQIDENIVDLENALMNLRLKFINEDDERQGISLSGLIEHAMKWDIKVGEKAQSLVRDLSIQTTVVREELLEQLAIIEGMINHNNEKKELRLNGWLNMFTRELQQHIVVCEEGIEYEKYRNACLSIEKVYERYIDYYAWLTRDEILYEGELPHEMISTLNSVGLFSRKLNAIQAREWRRIIEME